MAAAYAALFSLSVTLEQIPNPDPPMKPHIEHLSQTIIFLQEFLERNSNRSIEFQDLEIKITDLCLEAEDMVESHEIDQIRLRSQKEFNIFDQICQVDPVLQEPKDISMFLYEYLQVLRKEFDSIKRKALQLDKSSTSTSLSSRYAPRSIDTTTTVTTTNNNNTSMVGFEDHMIQVLGMMTSHESSLQIVPIVGMGGIGKTTLAHNVYNDELVIDYFEIRLWSGISQSYNVDDTFRRFLIQLENVYNIKSPLRTSSDELGVRFYQTLIGRRYIVVLDDVWSVEVWDEMKRYFPDDTNGSRVIITTRELKVASDFGSSRYDLQLLDEDKSWDLLKDKVFAKGYCPPMLEVIGRKIAISCKGLPLAIAVIGGQLAKSNLTNESWQSVADDVNSVLSSQGNDDCLKILSLSYDNLPIQLKPCFMFMGGFPEDHEVRVSKLVMMWVAEGILRPIKDKCLEDTALEYLTDLVDRNLILVSKRGSRGKIVACQIHDLLRDVCLREAHKQNFLCTIRSCISCSYPFEATKLNRNIERLRRDGSILYPSRSLTMMPQGDLCLHWNRYENWNNMLLSVRYRLLTFSADLARDHRGPFSQCSALMYTWRNLQTLIMTKTEGDHVVILPPQIWEMTLLRHLEIEWVVLPDPPSAESEKSHFVLGNLHTLLNVHNLKFSPEVLERIPNLKKLKITYTEEAPECVDSLSNLYYFRDLDQLLKLESLNCSINTNISARTDHISFPLLLKKLTLDGGRMPWEDMTTVGLLPNLEVLRLRNHAFCGTEWTPIEGQFCKLKSLHLQTICLPQWEVEHNHFPRLESLVICDLWGLEEIPLSFGDFEALKLISLEFCSTSLVNSAKALKEDQEDIGNYQIQVQERLTNNARDKVWILEKHLMDTPPSLSYELADEIRGLSYEANGAIEAMVKNKYENNIHLLSILKEVEGIRPSLQSIYAIDEADSHVPSVSEGHEENIETPVVRRERIVGFEDAAAMLIGYLKEETERLDVISIEGRIHGQGKSTLAEKVFRDPEIQLEFPTRIWVNCFKEFKMNFFYLEILKAFTEVIDMINTTNKELALIVAAYLQTTKFLIVLDLPPGPRLYDLHLSLPKTGKILIIHRNPLDDQTHTRIPYQMPGLTKDESWLLLQLEVFGEPESPEVLEDHGRVIVERCRGSPLAIVLIGTLLANKVSSTEDLTAMTNTWKNVAQDLTKIPTWSMLETILSLSYENLPYPLRACFLYLGMFPALYEIPAWKLTRMWISEGFIQHKDGLSLEDVAENYLDLLINRNLVRVDKRRRDGKVKTCRICSTLRDFCLLEAQRVRENFFLAITRFGDILQNSCRLFISNSDINFEDPVPYCPLVRSFLYFSNEEVKSPTKYTPAVFKLLRVLEIKPIKFANIPTGMFELVYLKYIAISLNLAILPREFSELWNLQTLTVDTEHRTLEVKADLLKMKKLRHFKTNASASLPNPESASTGGENIQTLGAVSPQSCTRDEFSYKVRNLKKLGIRGRIAELHDSKNGSIDFLAKLENLEELKLANDVFPLPPHEGKLHGLPQFPPKLRSLTLTTTFLDWTYMSILGQLENLKVLKLKDEAFVGDTWATANGGFRELEALYINRTDLVFWTASKDHFPSLKSLELRNCEELIQIPIELADIPSFQVLQLYGTNSATDSAREIRSRKEDGQTSNNNRFELSIFAQVCSRTLIDLDT